MCRSLAVSKGYAWETYTIESWCSWPQRTSAALPGVVVLPACTVLLPVLHVCYVLPTVLPVWITTVPPGHAPCRTWRSGCTAAPTARPTAASRPVRQYGGMEYKYMSTAVQNMDGSTHSMINEAVHAHGSGCCSVALPGPGARSSFRQVCRLQAVGIEPPTCKDFVVASSCMLDA